MFSIESLVANQGRDEPLRHTWLRSRAGSHLCIVIPDIGLAPRGVVLSFVVWAFLREGADVVWLELPYQRSPQFEELPIHQQHGWMLADLSAAVMAARAQRRYRRLSLVAKSRGTVALALLLGNLGLDCCSEAIWISPYLDFREVTETIRDLGGRSLVVTGSSDTHFDPVAIDRMQQRQVRLEVISKADQDLVISGEEASSLSGVARLEHELGAFLRKAMTDRTRRRFS